MKHPKRLFAEISKSEAQEDGTIKVWGYASSGAVDSDGETITAAAMKAALPDYMTFGAVREMHDSKKAAGTAIEASVDDDGRTFFGAHIVDAEAVKKVQAGVYKGFSIGGKITERDDLNKTIIKGIKLIEVSLVDRPANPEAVITIMKTERTPEDDVDELATMLDNGDVTPAEVLEFIKAAKAAPAKTTETIVKGMTHVAELAYLLKQITYLCNDQMAEAVREGDGSAVPGKLADWLNAGGEILKDMVTEEVGELMPEPEDASCMVMGPIYLADKALAIATRGSVEMAKAGKALSAASMKQVNSIHEACVVLGACAGANAAAAEKSAHLHDDDMKKVNDQLSKAESDLAKADARATAAELALTALKAKPAPGKALLKSVALSISKVEDAQELNKAESPAAAPALITDPLELIKAAQKSPISLSFR